jgi:hypothetical protein
VRVGPLVRTHTEPLPSPEGSNYDAHTGLPYATEEAVSPRRKQLRDSFLQVRVQLGEALQVGLGEENSFCGPDTL